MLKEFDFAQFGKDGLPLKYSRADFNSKVEELLKELTEKESEIILKHFGLERGTVGFDGILNNRAFDSTEVSENARKIAGQIQKEIENFTSKNEVMIEDEAVKEVLDGLIKGLPEFTSVDGKTLDIRHWVKNHFIEEMKNKGYNLTDKEYAALSQYLFSKKYLSQINNDVQVGDKLISAEDLKDALAKSRDSLFEGNEHSEIIPINPKVKGVFAKVENLEDCPQEFLEFAKEHELPVILMKPSKQNNDTSQKLNKLK